MGRFGINEDYVGSSTHNQQDDEHVNIDPEVDNLLNKDPMDFEQDEVEAEGPNDDNPDNDDEVSIPIMLDVLDSNANGLTNHQEEVFDLNMPATSEPPSLYPVILFFSTTHPEVPADSIDIPTGNWGNPYDSNVGELALGMIFKSKDHLKASVQDFSVRFARREYRVLESSSKLWKVVCKYDAETGCNWMLRAIYKSNMGLFKITRYAGPHTCLMNESSVGHRNLGKNMIATYLLDMVCQDPTYDIRYVQQNVKDWFGFEISYHKAWQALKAAREEVYRTRENSVQKFPR